MIKNENLEKSLFNEIEKALKNESEFLEVKCELEIENGIPKIFSIVEGDSWGTLQYFFKVKNEDLFYTITIDSSLPIDFVHENYFPYFEIMLIIVSSKNLKDLLNESKIKPNHQFESSLHSQLFYETTLTPNLFENQIMEFLDYMDKDQNNFQKVLNENMGYLSIGISQNEMLKTSNYLESIRSETIRRLSFYNLGIQFGQISK